MLDERMGGFLGGGRATGHCGGGAAPDSIDVNVKRPTPTTRDGFFEQEQPFFCFLRNLRKIWSARRRPSFLSQRVARVSTRSPGATTRHQVACCFPGYGYAICGPAKIRRPSASASASSSRSNPQPRPQLPLPLPPPVAVAVACCCCSSSS
jgi:hypothetical protein